MKNIFYGWWVVLASFLTLFVCVGIGFQSLPVFLGPIAADTSWGVDKLSIAGAIMALAAGFATPAVGYAVDRFGARAVMIPGAILITGSFLLLGKVASINQMYFLFLFFGAGLAMTTILPTQTLVSLWFAKKRGRAMGIVSMGAGLGVVVCLPIMNRLVETLGWRDAYSVLGIIVAVVLLPSVVFLIRSSPASMGLQVDGASDPSSEAGTPEAEAPSPPEESGYELREAFRTSSFWLILGATFFGVFAGGGFGFHIILSLSESGLTRGNAALAWSATMGVSIAGRILFGYLSEKRQKRYFAFGADIARTVSVLLLVLFALGVIPLGAAVVQLAVLYGLFLGCNAVMAPLLISETFGVKSFGKIMGAIGIPYTIGMALGQVVGGRLYSLYGNYVVAFSVFAAGILIAGILLVLARPVFLLDGEPAAKENPV